MIRASVLYANAPGGRFDFDYYLGTHLPFARGLLGSAGLVRIEVDRGVSGEDAGTTARYACVAHLYFETVDAYYAAMAEHGEALGEDVPNYTDLELEIQVSEIVI
jgi:uncharacterized protein (TIGR02118 family)